MALQLHLSTFFFHNRTRHPHYFTVRCQKLPDSSDSTTNLEDSDSLSTTTQNSSSSSGSSSSSPGVGFGGSSLKNGSVLSSSKKKQKGKRERDSIIVRRSPVEKPAFVSQIDENKAKEMQKNESAFLLAWLGFGAVILFEGLFIASSGFLPEELDKFCVNYLYPSFTPTVFVFVAGTVVYGVYKYLQNEKIGGQE